MPFRGGPEALTEVIAGRVEFYFCPINTALPYIREGKLVALVTSARPRLPNCRTCRPRSRPATTTPISDLDRHAGAGQDAARDGRQAQRRDHQGGQAPATLERLAKTGVAPLILTPAEFAARIRAEIADNIAVAKAAGIKPN